MSDFPCSEEIAAQYRLYLAGKARAAASLFPMTRSSDASFDSVSQQDQHAWRMAPLLSPLGMDTLLKQVSRRLQAPNAAVAGSLFVKMYARILTGAWKLLSVYNARVNLPLSQTTFIWPETADSAAILLPQADPQPLPARPDERCAARDQWLDRTIEDHLRPLLEAVSFRSGLSKAVLWENVFIYLHHGYGEWKRAAASEEESARLASDYEALAAEGRPFRIPGGSFEDPLHPGEQLRIRRTCCLKHTLPADGKPCYTCPNVNADDRIRILLAKHK